MNKWFDVKFSADFTRNRERLMDVCALIEQKAKNIQFIQSGNKQVCLASDVREIITESVKEVFGEYCTVRVLQSSGENNVFYVVKESKFVTMEF